MAEYGITETGVNIKRVDTILDELHTDLSTGWGVNTRANPQSYLNVLLTSVSDKLAELWEFGKSVYDNYHPSSAEGAALDDACQFTGVSRENATPSIYPIHCTGIDGTILPTGTRIRSNTNPTEYFYLPTDGSIGRSSCNSAVIRTTVETPPAGSYTIYFAVDDTTFSASYSAAAATTENTVLAALATAINTHSEVSASVDTDTHRLTVVAADVTKSIRISMTDNLTTDFVTSIVDFYSENNGNIYLPDNSITIKVQAPSSFESCTNKAGYTAGRLRETDVELRNSYANKVFNTADRTLDAIRSAVLANVTGVNSVTVFENSTNTTVDGRPPHSIEVVVDGGNPTDICTQILAHKAGGISTYGDSYEDIIGSSGDTVRVYYSRQTDLYVFWNFTVYKKSTTTLPTDWLDQIGTIVSNFMSALEIGEDVIPQKVFGNIYTQIPGIEYMDVLLCSQNALTPDPDPSDYTDKSVTTTAKQKAVYGKVVGTTSDV